jgi:hypothetical protein
MPKYFMTWELDNARTPVDPKERGGMWTQMLGLSYLTKSPTVRSRDGVDPASFFERV